MPVISYAPAAVVQGGYSLEASLGLALADTAGAPLDACWFSLTPGGCTLEDQHEENEIWLIFKGSGILEVDGRRLQVSAGASLHFEPFTRHRLFNDANSEMRVFSVYWGAPAAERNEE